MPHSPSLLRKVAGFALVSGAGLGLDFALFLLLVGSDVAPGLANLASAAAAVVFVFFASVRHVFSYGGGFLLGLFSLYVLYQCAAVLAASWAVGGLATHMPPALAKLAVLPVTFGANFAFMSLLTRGMRAGARSEKVRHG